MDKAGVVPITTLKKYLWFPSLGWLCRKSSRRQILVWRKVPFFSRIFKEEFLFHLSPKFGPFWLKWKRRKSPFWWYFLFRLSFPTSAVKIFSFHWALFDLSCDRRPYFGGIPLISLSFFFWTTCSPPPKKFLTLADGGPQSQIRSQSQIKSPDCGGDRWLLANIWLATGDSWLLLLLASLAGHWQDWRSLACGRLLRSPALWGPSAGG